MATSVTAIPQAGSYELDAATLYDINGGATDIKNLIVEFNIYESMFQPFVTGNLIINDATNLLNSLPIVGQEELELKFRTRGAEKPESMVDFSLHRLRVVGVKDRLQTKDKVILYRLELASKESMKNVQMRLSKAYEDTPSEIVKKILKNELKTKKKVFVEPTRDNRKYVVPNLYPFKAIQTLAKTSTSKETGQNRYVFYENADGFHFRTIQSHFTDANGDPVQPVQFFRYFPATFDSGIAAQHQNISELKVNNNQDQLKRSIEGAYASKQFIHDITKKEVRQVNYNHFEDFRKNEHLENINASGPVYSRTAEDEFDNTLNDFSDNRIIVSGKSSYLHSRDDTDLQDYMPEVNKIPSVRAIAYNNRTVNIEFIAPGISDFRVGDVVDIFIPKNRPLRESEKTRTDQQDKYLSGRYLITSLRHFISVGNAKYNCVFGCIKDNVLEAYPENSKDRFKDYPSEVNSDIVEI